MNTARRLLPLTPLLLLAACGDTAAWQAEQDAHEAAAASANLGLALACVAGGVAVLGALALAYAAARLALDVYARWHDAQNIAVDANGNLPLPRHEVARGAGREYNLARVQVAQTAAQQSGAVSHSVHYEVNGATGLPANLDQVPALAPPGAPLVTTLPGPCTEDQILDWGWQPSNNILLGLRAGAAGLLVPDPSQYIAVPGGEKFCHVAELGSTGGGKTMAIMRKMVYLIAAGKRVFWINHKYTPRHTDTGFEFATIATATALGRVILDMDEGIDLLLHVAEVELPRRIKRFNEGLDPGPEEYYFVGEMPALVDRAKERNIDLITRVARWLREGRELKLYLAVELQDALIKTLGGSTGLRAQINTVGYYGGDSISARGLLRVSVTEPAGRGVGWLRCASALNPELVRIPLLTNTAVGRILNTRSGPVWSGVALPPDAVIVDSTSRPVLDPTPPPDVAARWRYVQQATAPPVPVEGAGSGPEAAGSGNPPHTPTQAQMDRARKREVVRGLVRQSIGATAIITQVWGVSSGRAFQAASQEYNSIVAELVPEGDTP